MFTFESIYTKKVGGLSEVPPRLGEALNLLGVKTEIYTPNHALTDACQDPIFETNIDSKRYCIKELKGTKPVHYIVGGGLLDEPTVYPSRGLVNKSMEFARVLVEFFRDRMSRVDDRLIFHGHDWHSIPVMIGLNKLSIEQGVRAGFVLHVHLGTRNKIEAEALCNKLHICSGTLVRGDLGVTEFRYYYNLSHGIIERLGAMLVDKVVTVSMGYVKELVRLIGLNHSKKVDYVFNAAPLKWDEVKDIIRNRFNVMDPLDTSNRLLVRDRLLTRDLIETKIQIADIDVSEWVTKLLDKYGIIYNEPFKLTGPLLFLVGRLSKQKGFDYLLRSLDKLTLHESKLRIIIAAVPTTWEIELLRSWFETVLSYPDNLRILPGMLSKKDLVPLYYAANATLVPSRSEPFGLVALESMSSGTPVAASRTGGLSNIVIDIRIDKNHGNGVLFTPGDIGDMVESVIHLVRITEELYKSSDILLDIRKRCIERTRDFNWELSARKTLEIYNEILVDSMDR